MNIKYHFLYLIDTIEIYILTDMMEIPNPSKSNLSFQAELYFTCTVNRKACASSSSHALCSTRLSIGKELTQSSRKVSIVENVDLFKPPDLAKGTLQFFIFDPKKYKVSGDKKALETSRKLLLKDIREASKVSEQNLSARELSLSQHQRKLKIDYYSMTVDMKLASKLL
jgi:hypothetical protein